MGRLCDIRCGMRRAAVGPGARQTLTYDQGKEMAPDKKLAESTGLRIFLANLHSPWQRGRNENITV